MNKKLHIVFVTNNYKPYSGGVVSSIDSFTQELFIQGHKVTIITLDFLGQSLDDDPPYVLRIFSPVRFYYKGNPLAVPWRPDSTLFTIIKKLNPDIIHTHHPFLLGISALKTGKKLNIPVIFTYHTRYEHYLHYLPMPSAISRPIVQRFAFSYCNEVAGIIAPSASTKIFLEGCAIKSPIHVIPSGILPLFLQPSFQPRKINMPFKLLTVSRFTKEKNIPFLLDVIANLRTRAINLKLIGYGPELEYLQHYAYQTLNLSKELVHFIIRPPKHEIAAHYLQSDLFIFASQTETQGLVLAEAMANGLPIIALNGPGQTDIVRHGKNGFLIENVEEMTKKIQEIMQNPALHTKLQKSAWETGQEFSAATMTEKLINVYQTLLS